MSIKKRSKKKKVKKKIVLNKFSLGSLLVLIFSIWIIFFHNDISSFARKKLSFGNLNSNLVGSINTDSTIDYDRDVLFESNKYGIVKCENNKLIFHNKYGKALWKKEINASIPLISVGEKSIIVADGVTGDIYSVSHMGKINKHIVYPTRIKEVNILNENNIVIISEENNNVSLLDNSLEEKSKIILPKGELIDYDFSNKQNTIAFSFIKMDKNNFYSNILLYKLNGELIGATNFEQEYVFDIKYIDDNVVGILDNQIFILDSENHLQNSLEIDRQINELSINDDELIYLNLTKNPENITDTRPDNVISVLNLKGEKQIKDIIIDTPIDNMISDDQYLIFSSDKKLYHLNKKNGELLKIQTLKKVPLNIYPIDKDLFAVEHIDKFNIYSVSY